VDASIFNLAVVCSDRLVHKRNDDFFRKNFNDKTTLVRHLGFCVDQAADLLRLQCVVLPSWVNSYRKLEFSTRIKLFMQLENLEHERFKGDDCGRKERVDN